ncbi:hypothetical protein B0H10DRAFT_2086494 [Mycena sp. CBHHK59/15]|nr:hypothetical protein B0H10DRAFT_2086494 [Mycena sp. CBHHK59/15]
MYLVRLRRNLHERRFSGRGGVCFSFVSRSRLSGKAYHSISASKREPPLSGEGMGYFKLDVHSGRLVIKNSLDCI